MTARQVASTAQLLRASSDDESALQYPLPDSGFGFYAQQAVEKLYQAILTLRNGAYPFSHDLRSPRRRIEATGLTLPICSFRLEELAEYAGNARYDDPLTIDATTREVLRGCISALRGYVLNQIDLHTAPDERDDSNP